MRYYLHPSAEKELGKFPAAVQRRIMRKLDFYTSSVDPLVFAKPLRNSHFGNYRFRVGNYRIIFDIFEDNLYVLAIEHRKDAY